MKKIYSIFALAAVMLLGANLSAHAETIEQDLSSVGAQGYIKVYEEGTIYLEAYVTCTVTKMPTSSNPGCLTINSVLNKETFQATTNVYNAVSIDGTITDKSGRKFIINQIADNAFKDCNKVTSIKLGSISNFKANMEKFGFIVGDNAFKGCTALTSFTSANGTIPMTKIGDFAFENCSKLTTWGEVKDGDATIGYYAFHNCSSITSLVLAGEIDDHAFDGCTGVETLYWYGNGKGHSSQYNYTYSNSPIYPLRGSLKELTLYSGVPGRMFYGCKQLTTVSTPADIWDNLKNINVYEMGAGNNAFGNCSALKSVQIAGQINGTAFASCPALTEITYRGAYMSTSSQPTDYYDGFFTSAENLTTIRIESTSTSTVPNVFVPDYMCWYLGKLTSVTIPNYVTTIGISAFQDCTALQSVTLPASVKYIDESAFEGCTSLSLCPVSATNSALKSIGKKAFANTAINTLYVPESVTYMGGLLVDKTKTLKAILFYTRSLTKNAVGGSYANLFFSANGSERTNVEQVYINPELTVIPDSLFYGFSGLQRLADKNGNTNLSSIKTIEQAAFYGCTSLWDAYGPNQLPNLTTVGASAFEASNFHSIELPKLKTIGKRAFANTTLMYIHDLGSMPDLTVISEEAFADNAKLAIATFAGVTTIGERAFANDAKLETINISKVTPAIQSNSFEGCSVKSIRTSCSLLSELLADVNWKAVCSDIKSLDNSYKYPSNMDDFWNTKTTTEIVQELDCDGIFIIRAIPYEGCTFLYWNDGNTDNPRTIDLNEYTSSWLYAISASEEDFHTTHFTVEPENAGWLQITNQYGHNRNNQKFPVGEMAKITPMELNGWYEFDEWQYETGDMMEAPYVCDIETAPQTMCVSINYTFDAGGGGEGGYMDPETGEWMPGEPVEPELRPMFDENMKAVFALKAVPVAVERCTDGNGTVELSEVYSSVGSTITLTATPKEGFEFDQWEDGNKDATREVTIMPEMLIERQPMGWDPELGEETYNEYPVDMGDGMLEAYHPESSYKLSLCAKFKAATGINDVQGDNVRCTKVLRDGVLYIMYNGTMYNVQGQRVK